MFDTPDLIALLGSRICHDLISPIGAISNGVELLMMDGGSMGPEIALIAESVANANARIRFFRVAFGSSGPDQRIGRTEVVSILSDLTRGGRLTIEWRCAEDLPRREVKLAFLIIQCIETAMAFGGRILVDQQNGKWTITGSAAKLKLDQTLWDGLANSTGSSDLTAAQVHFALVPIELRSQNRTLAADIGPTEIRMSF
jgi:histidine phosphotransferase ChpT